MRKTIRIISAVLLLALLLGVCPMIVFADNTTGTITAKDADNNTIGTYSTIDAAAAAAGTNGKVVLSAGDFYFNGRQTISVEGVTLEGAGVDQTFIKTSSNYANASATNKKALLTIAADNVTVKDLTIDASSYGDTITSETDFIVVRINSGTGISLNNIFVTGSPRTLIKIGTSTDSASVTATSLNCQAEYKAIPQLIGEDYTHVYADIDINRGSFTLESGAVHGFIKKESNGTFTNNAASGTPKYYNLIRRFVFVNIINVTTTTKHFVYSYDHVRIIEDDSSMSTFVSVVLSNKTKIQNMTTEAAGSGDRDLITKFITLLDDVLDTSYDSDIAACKTQLETALAVLPA